MRRTLAALLIAGLCVLGSGCAHCGWLYEPFGPGTLCTGGPGCDGCGAAACGTCEAPACDTCSTPACGGPAPCSCQSACDPCGTPCPGTCGSPCGPLAWLFTVLNAGFCGDGCGEIWWGDFHSAPPTCCEPCNRMGEWTGQAGGGVPVRSEGCSSCGGGSTIDYTFQDRSRVLAGPSRAASRPVKATPVSQAAKPIPTVRR